MKLAILASGSGTNAQAIFDHIRDKSLDASVELLICNNPDAKVIERAKKANVATRIVERKNFGSRNEFDAKIVSLLRQSGSELVVLAGYMLLVGDIFFEAFPDRIINLHPAILPAFPGLHSIERAWEHGVKLTGASVHIVEKEVDSGPLIIQAALTVPDDEDLAQLEARVHAIEHRILPQAIQWFATGRLKVTGRRVQLAPGPARPAPLPPDCLVWPLLEEGF